MCNCARRQCRRNSQEKKKTSSCLLTAIKFFSFNQALNGCTTVWSQATMEKIKVDTSKNRAKYSSGNLQITQLLCVGGKDCCVRHLLFVYLCKKRGCASLFIVYSRGFMLVLCKYDVMR